MAGLGSEPRGMFERRNALQKQKYPELDLATPNMVSQVDALRVGENRLPSLLTRETTKLAADIVRSKPPPLPNPNMYNPTTGGDLPPVGTEGRRPIVPEPADEGGGGGFLSGIAGGIGDVAGDVAGSFVSDTTGRVAGRVAGVSEDIASSVAGAVK